MKSLTLRQPWAHFIIHGQKRIENRSWPTSHRGPLLIHAGSNRSELDARPWSSWERRMPGLKREDLVFGAILGVVEVIDCVPWEDVKEDRWAEGPWCWLLENVRAFPEPVPYSGAQGLFSVPDHLLPVLKS
jgi:hypothetical protein